MIIFNSKLSIMSETVNKGSSLLEPGQKVTKPAVDDKLAAKLIWDLYGLEAAGIKVRTKVSVYKGQAYS